MPPNAEFLPNQAQSEFPSGQPDSYDPEVAKNEISEAQLNAATQAGARLLRVVVVYLAATAGYIPYIRLSDRAGYHRLATRKLEGARTFRNFQTLQRAMAEYGYPGPFYVAPEGHSFLRRLGIGTERT